MPRVVESTRPRYTLGMRPPLLASLVAVALLAPLAAQLPPAATGDLLVSSSSNNRLLRLSFDGRELASIALAGLAHPRGIVVVRSGTVYLVSQNSSEVLVLDRALALVRRFPTTNVTAPTGAALGPNGNLFVAGFGSSNVGEYRTDGTFVRTYSGGGLVSANCVAFAPSGDFYVASAATNQVVRFDSAGNPIGAFTGFGLSSPMGIAIWQGEVYVAGGGSDNIAVFDLVGAPRRELRHPDLRGPQGVAFTAEGLLATSGFYNHKIVWLRPDGTHVRSVTPPSSSVPRSVAFLHGVDLEYVGSPVLGAPFPLTVTSPFEPNTIHLTAVAFSAQPGLPLPDGRVFPATPDILFQFSTSGVAAFANFVGFLDASGRASAAMTFPDFDFLRGVKIYGAALTFDPGYPGLFRQVSRSFSWTL
jgi:hypothetical protein